MEEKKVVKLTEKTTTQEIINNYKDTFIIELKTAIFGLIIQNNIRRSQSVIASQKHKNNIIRKLT